MHVCAWLWLPPAVSVDGVVVDIPLAYVVKDKTTTDGYKASRVADKLQQTVFIHHRLRMAAGSLTDGRAPRNKCLAVRSLSLLAACSAFSLDFALLGLSPTMMTFDLHTRIDAAKQLESIILDKTRIGVLLYP